MLLAPIPTSVAALVGNGGEGPIAEALVALGDLHRKGRISRESGDAAYNYYLDLLEEAGPVFSVIGPEGLVEIEDGGAPPDAEAALRAYTKAGDLGGAGGYFALARLYLRGRLVPYDAEKAFTLARKAETLGSHQARFMIGFMSLNGIGTKQNFRDGLSRMTSFAFAGDPTALRELGRFAGASAWEALSPNPSQVLAVVLRRDKKADAALGLSSAWSQFYDERGSLDPGPSLMSVGNLTTQASSQALGLIGELGHFATVSRLPSDVSYPLALCRTAVLAGFANGIFGSDRQTGGFQCNYQKVYVLDKVAAAKVLDRVLRSADTAFETARHDGISAGADVARRISRFAFDKTALRLAVEASLMVPESTAKNAGSFGGDFAALSEDAANVADKPFATQIAMLPEVFDRQRVVSSLGAAVRETSTGKLSRPAALGMPAPRPGQGDSQPVRAMVSITEHFNPAKNVSPPGVEAAVWDGRPGTVSRPAALAVVGQPETFDPPASGSFAEAQQELAVKLIQDGAHDSDIVRGLAILEELGANGYDQALLSLGDAYSRGHARFVDVSAALDAYEAAAASGNQEALLRLSHIYRTALFGVSDPERAFSFLREAAALGSQRAMFELGQGLIDGEFESAGTVELGISLLRQAESRGVSEAAVELAVLGENGRSLDTLSDGSFERLSALAASGNAGAALRLVAAYRDGYRNGAGEPVPPDLDSARRVLADFGGLLSPEDSKIQSLLIDLSRARPRDLPDLIAATNGIAPNRRREIVGQIARINPNAYVFMLQSKMSEQGFYDDEMNGVMTSSTNGAVVDFCESLKIGGLCKLGPFSPAVTGLLAPFL